MWVNGVKISAPSSKFSWRRFWKFFQKHAKVWNFWPPGGLDPQPPTCPHMPGLYIALLSLAPLAPPPAGDDSEQAESHCVQYDRRCCHPRLSPAVPLPVSSPLPPTLLLRLSSLLLEHQSLPTSLFLNVSTETSHLEAPLDSLNRTSYLILLFALSSSPFHRHPKTWGSFACSWSLLGAWLFLLDNLTALTCQVIRSTSIENAPSIVYKKCSIRNCKGNWLNFSKS